MPVLSFRFPFTKFPIPPMPSPSPVSIPIPIRAVLFRSVPFHYTESYSSPFLLTWAVS